ncbi:MAG: hypothetical protein ACO29U_01300 [Crocinitomicaceae bacterium]
MKRELDPFESKLKEKLQGKTTFPEDILWKRLNDELIRSDREKGSNKRFWLFGTAMLVLISLGTGYFIGINQNHSNRLTSDTKSLSSQKFKKNTSFSSKKLRPASVRLLSDSLGTQKQLNPFIQANSPLIDSAVTSNELKKQQSLISTLVNQSSTFEKNTDETPPLSVSTETISTISQPMTNFTDAVLFEELTPAFLPIQKPKLITTIPTIRSKKMTSHRYAPFLLSTSLALEPMANNRVQMDRVYGKGSSFTQNEVGHINTNLKFGLQAQFGRHLEVGIGITASNYQTSQTVQNQVVSVDPIQHHIQFESSVHSFEIHENHLHDDPEDQEENELNFEDSTEFHLNYQLSNNIRSIQIPLSIGFVLNWSNVKFSVKSGIIYNQFTSANQLVNISGFNPIRNDIQSQLVSHSFYHMIQLGAEIPVSTKLSFFLAPKYAYSLRSISKTNLLRPNSLGVECALKYYF